MNDTVEARSEKLEIDIEEIMREIRAEILAKGFTDDVMPFDVISVNDDDSDFDMGLLEAALSHYAARCNVNPYPSIGSRRGFIGKVISLMKKIIRKFITFHITPIILEVNSSNRQALEIFIHLRNYIKFQMPTEERLVSVELDLSHGIKKTYFLLEQQVKEISKQHSEVQKLLKLYKDRQKELEQALARTESELVMLRLMLQKQMGDLT